MSKAMNAVYDNVESLQNGSRSSDLPCTGWPPLDRRLPTLAAAMDTGRMLDLFRRHVFVGEGEAAQPQRCELARIRYRAGRRAILQYRILAAHDETGRPVWHHVTGTLYPGERAAHLARKLNKQHAPASRRAGEPPAAVYLGDVDMLVQRFPWDRRLPSLRKFMEDPSGRLQSIEDPGSRHGTDWDVALVRYRAGLSAVLRCDRLPSGHRQGDAPRQRYFVKIYRESDEADRAVRTLDAVAGHQSDLQATPAVGRLEDLNLVVLPAAVGTTLEAEWGGRGDLRQARMLGERIAAFHRSRVALDRIHATSDQRANLRRAAERLQWACPELAGTIDHLLPFVLTIDDVALCPTHRDLKPEHVFFDGESVTVIDWDSCALSDPVLDLAMLLARAKAAAARTPHVATALDVWSQTFKQAYFANVPRAWHGRLAVHYAGAALEIAGGFFSRQEPGWRHTVHALVAEAVAAASGDGRFKWE